MADDRPMIHIRLPRDLVRQLDIVAAFQGTDRASTVEDLLETAIRCLERHDTTAAETNLAKVLALTNVQDETA